MTTKFAELGLAPALVETLAALGYEEPTPIQEQALPAIISGRDVLGQAATGTGKTGAFALPLLQRHVLGKPAGAPLVLVLAPTRELAIQVSEAFHSYGKSSGVIVAPIYGGQEYGRQIRLLQRGVHVVVATPGRALDHIRRGTMDLSNIQAIVLDEADEMLDMGFAEDIDAVFDALPAEHQTALFSATLPPRIAAMADTRLQDPLRILIPRERTAEGAAPRVRQTAYVVGRAHREAALGRVLDVESPQLAIVFARTRNEVDELAEHLRGRGYGVEALHGGLDQTQRDRVMKRARAGQIDVIVATDVAARGIDIDHLTHVFNYGIPASLETYVHRIGRTGRAGREGVAITLMEPREHRSLRAIEGMTKTKIEVRAVPTATDVRAKRIDMTRAALREALLEPEALDRFRVVIETLAEEFDALDVAAAAIKLAHEATSGGTDDDVEIPSATSFDRPRRDKPRGEWQSRGDRSEFKPREGAPRRGRDEGMVRIFIGAGREAGVRPGDLVGAIANEAGISARKIGAIEIAERFSLVEVDGPVANVVIDALRGSTIKGRQFTVRRDQPKRATTWRERGGEE